ncbi:MAG: hypothetical protein U1E46_10570 [Hyphomicrobiales bacterium]
MRKQTYWLAEGLLWAFVLVALFILGQGLFVGTAEDLAFYLVIGGAVVAVLGLALRVWREAAHLTYAECFLLLCGGSFDTPRQTERFDNALSQSRVAAGAVAVALFLWAAIFG